MLVNNPRSFSSAINIVLVFNTLYREWLPKLLGMEHYNVRDFLKYWDYVEANGCVQSQDTA